MIAYIARQPILNMDEETIGYELLFRNSRKNSFPNIDPDEATTKIISQNQLTLGLDQICQNKLAFVNFHEEALLHLFPTSLDSKTTVVEILEDVPITDELIKACEVLYGKGYKLALDDHEFNQDWQVLYPYISIIKVDISDYSELDLELFAQYIRSEFSYITLLAERVETAAQLNMLKDFGYSLFQGYFFSKPEIIEQISTNPDKVRLLKLITLMGDPEVTFDEIADIMEFDPIISFKLLRFISTSSYAEASQITTVKHALSYLGLYEIRKFIALIAVADLNADNCEEILTIALIRAKFCEFMGMCINNEQDLSSAYLIGLLSMISAILQTEQEVLITKIPISDDMKNALLHRTGKLGTLLTICENYEYADWNKVEQSANELGLSLDDIGEAYHQALEWHVVNPICGIYS